MTEILLRLLRRAIFFVALMAFLVLGFLYVTVDPAIVPGLLGVP